MDPTTAASSTAFSPFLCGAEPQLYAEETACLDYGFCFNGKESMCWDQGQVHVAEEEAFPAVRPDWTSRPRDEAIK